MQTSSENYTLDMSVKAKIIVYLNPKNEIHDLYRNKTG